MVWKVQKSVTKKKKKVNGIFGNNLVNKQELVAQKWKSWLWLYRGEKCTNNLLFYILCNKTTQQNP